jgi:hypothetical protein
MRDYFDAPELKAMFIAGANNLAANKEMINDLNVFPVPDGDTGTNMSLTVMSAVKELDNLTQLNYKGFAKALSMGALMGARGNSGVILSQIFRGFSAVIGEASVVDKEVFAEATKHAAEIAYKAVIKPVEGTILTIARALSDAAETAKEQSVDIDEMFSYMISEGFKVLDKTPDMLPALKQANVVDAGGMGLMVLMQGAEAYLRGVEIETTYNVADVEVIKDHNELREEDIIFPYCTELFIKGINLQREIIIHELSKIDGDSLVVVVQDGMAKIHMHANDPGKILEYAVNVGSLHDIKIENMREQFESQRKKPENIKEYGFLCVAAGEGLKEIARSMGVDHIVSGGQTMNPSTEDIVAGINEVHAKTVFVLPNNKNIIMAAEQSRHILKDVDIRVIPSRSFAQGMATLIAFNPGASFDENEASMKDALKGVVSAEVTYAVRDTEFDGHTIKEGEILGLAEGKIEITGESVQETTLDLIGKVVEDQEIITLYYGEDVSQEEANKLAKLLEGKYEEAEIELYYGGQPLYHYLISIE